MRVITFLWILHLIYSVLQSIQKIISVKRSKLGSVFTEFVLIVSISSALHWIIWVSGLLK